MVSLGGEIFLLCLPAAMLTFFIAGLLFICALSTSITWERTPHPVRRPAFSSHLFTTVILKRLHEWWCNLLMGKAKRFLILSIIILAFCTVCAAKEIRYFKAEH